MELVSKMLACRLYKFMISHGRLPEVKRPVKEERPDTEEDCTSNMDP